MKDCMRYLSYVKIGRLNSQINDAILAPVGRDRFLQIGGA